MSQLTITFTSGYAATYIAEAAPTTNYGTNVNLLVKRATGSKFGEDKYASLLRCNLLTEGIPAGATILSTSKLRLYVSSVYGYGYTVVWHRGEYSTTPYYPWPETTVYWNHLMGFQGAPYGAWALPSATGWYEITGSGSSGNSIAEILQFALDYGHEDGVVGDLDICLFPGAVAALAGFIADSDDAASNQPQLVIDYTPPSAGGIRQQVITL